MQPRKRVMLLAVTALSSGVTIASCASSHGVTFVPPDAADDANPNDAKTGPDVLGFGVFDAGIIDAGIIADDVHVDDAGDASSE